MTITTIETGAVECVVRYVDDRGPQEVSVPKTVGRLIFAALEQGRGEVRSEVRRVRERLTGV